jgi:hypothetical protein
MAFESYYLVTPGKSNREGYLTQEGVVQLGQTTRELRRANLGKNVLMLSTFAGFRSALMLSQNLGLHKPPVDDIRIDEISKEPAVVEKPSVEIGLTITERKITHTSGANLIVVTTPFFMAAIGQQIKDRDEARVRESFGEVQFVEEDDNFRNPLYGPGFVEFFGEEIKAAIAVDRAAHAKLAS